jgi:hypothetical protein
MTATAVDHGLSFVTVKLQPYRQGSGREGSGEPNKPHLVFAKSHKRSNFLTASVYRGGEKLYLGASKSQFDKITITLHNLNPLTRRSLGRGLLRRATAKPCPGAELGAAADAFARAMCPDAAG